MTIYSDLKSFLENISQSKTQISANEDDAYHGTNGGTTWSNIGTTDFFGFFTMYPEIDVVVDAFFRFKIDLPFFIEGTHSMTLNILPRLIEGSKTYTVYLIDRDDCPSFPNGSGDQSNYPVTSTTASYTPGTVEEWDEIDLTDFLKDFMQRPGFSPGQYLGVKIDDSSATLGTVTGVYDSQTDVEKAAFIDGMDVDIQLILDMDSERDIGIPGIVIWKYDEIDSINAHTSSGHDYRQSYLIPIDVYHDSSENLYNLIEGLKRLFQENTMSGYHSNRVTSIDDRSNNKIGIYRARMMIQVVKHG